MDRRLETFLAVCQTMNYRRAAEALHLTQPAVTKQIQSLEASYGVRLFSYDGRKLRKTAPGSALEVFAISQRYQEQELERALHAAPRKILRVGATKTIGDYILPPAICSFVRAPEHELQFTVDNTTRLLGQLEAGQLDFVVVEGIFDKRRYEQLPAAGGAVYRHLRGRTPLCRAARHAGGAAERNASAAGARLRHAQHPRARADAGELQHGGIFPDDLHQQLSRHPRADGGELRHQLSL